MEPPCGAVSSAGARRADRINRYATAGYLLPAGERRKNAPVQFIMNMPRTRYFAFAALLILAAAPALAHNAICDCYDNGDVTVTCEAGFSDGAAAAGVPLRVLDGTGKVLVEGKTSEQSDFTFRKPAVDYRVELDAGEGHVVTIDGRDITE